MVLPIPVMVVVVKAQRPNEEIRGIRKVDLLSFVLVFSPGTEAHRCRNHRSLPALLLYIRNGH